MLPERIILVRHGVSEGNLDSSKYVTMFDEEIPLANPKGCNQAYEAGVELNKLLPEKSVIDAYISPFARTTLTWEYMKKSINQTIRLERFDPRLREQHWGEFETVEESEEALNIYTSSPLYGRWHRNGENGLEVYDRASSFISTMKEKFREHENSGEYNVVVVSHGMFFRIFLMSFFGWCPDELYTCRFPYNCELVVLQKDKYYDMFNLEHDLIYRPKEEKDKDAK